MAGHQQRLFASALPQYRRPYRAIVDKTKLLLLLPGLDGSGKPHWTEGSRTAAFDSNRAPPSCSFHCLFENYSSGFQVTFLGGNVQDKVHEAGLNIFRQLG